MAKNVLPKHWNGSEFEELHIVTKASNVFTNDNKSVQQKIDDFTSHLADYEYQSPSIVGAQIRITKQSNTNRLFFKLDDDLNGDITISLNNGATEKPLQDVSGEQITSLEKGFVEVVEGDSFFTLRARGGLSKADRLALIQSVQGLLDA